MCGGGGRYMWAAIIARLTEPKAVREEEEVGREEGEEASVGGGW